MSDIKWEKKVEQYHKANEIYRDTKYCTIERAAIMAGLGKSTYYRIKEELESEAERSTSQKPRKIKYQNYKQKLTSEILNKDIDLAPSISNRKELRQKNKSVKKPKRINYKIINENDDEDEIMKAAWDALKR